MSTELYRKALLENLRTNIWVGEAEIAVGESIKIDHLEQAHTAVFANLSARGETGAFSFIAMPNVNNCQYVVVKYPAEYTADDNNIPVIVLLVRDPSTLVRVDKATLDSIFDTVIDELLARHFVPAKEFETIFGTIPEWKNPKKADLSKGTK